MSDNPEPPTGDGPLMETGQVLMPALVSPVIDGRLSTWVEDQRVWEVDDARELADLIGRGMLARTSLEPKRFREVALIDEDAQTLAVVGRLRPGSSEPLEASAPAKVFQLREAAPAESDVGSAWADLAEFLSAVLLAASSRGEFVVVEHGGWEPPPTPYALALVAHDHAGGWVVHLEVSPLPSPSSLWPPPSDPAQDGQTVTAAASAEMLAVAGTLLTDAVSTWAESPLHVGLTFGSAPDGPWPPPGPRRGGTPEAS